MSYAFSPVTVVLVGSTDPNTAEGIEARELLLSAAVEHQFACDVSGYILSPETTVVWAVWVTDFDGTVIGGMHLIMDNHVYDENVTSFDEMREAAEADPQGHYLLIDGRNFAR